MKEVPKVIPVEKVPKGVSKEKVAVSALKNGFGHTSSVFRDLAGEIRFPTHGRTSSRVLTSRYTHERSDGE
ncbi:hypothetical protein DC3_57490 [Deinococcus cellulosilyticus NBRC 106333 = KACC 11606]|uniref:Uncharacterized protein n=1 Tax=Deinococcus cellulosilyticus (strain DSM 18568 / NBRC 106333 / KACC 11606 / 5516J-15) TaxID=1223518 RepID=A0A511NBE5_DEIC1|nr:hypothetical protein DC3_57490 [Deinococcus cellulosilyticus NBRC 106333 = KACC 11606]